MHGDRCYGCGGAGMKYTKRGAAAATYLQSLRMVRADSLKPGDKIRLALVHGAKWCRVEAVTIGEARAQGCYRGDGRYAQVKIECESKLTAYETPEALMQKAFTKEESSEQFAKAIAYQATLTKAGQERKARTKTA